jgi:hypothetical protein
MSKRVLSEACSRVATSITSQAPAAAAKAGRAATAACNSRSRVSIAAKKTGSCRPVSSAARDLRELPRPIKTLAARRACFRRAHAPAGDHRFRAIQARQQVRQHAVALVPHFRNGQQAAGAPGMSGHQQALALARGQAGNRQVIRGVSRHASIVGAEQGGIEHPAGIFEIVGVAAEITNAVFRRPDQPHVGVPAVAVQMVETALVERNHLGTDAGGGILPLDRSDHRSAGRRGGFWCGRGGHRRVHPGGNVGGRDQHV